LVSFFCLLVPHAEHADEADGLDNVHASQFQLDENDEEVGKDDEVDENEGEEVDDEGSDLRGLSGSKSSAIILAVQTMNHHNRKTSEVVTGDGESYFLVQAIPMGARLCQCNRFQQCSII
jgi:hypothetical protein